MQEVKKKKFIMCSDSLQSISGLGKSALRIAKGFYDTGEYDISYFVITGGDTDSSCQICYDEDFKDLFLDMKIYNCQATDINKFRLFDEYVSKEKPDIVFSLIDPWNLDQICNSMYRDTFYWVAYCLFEIPSYPEYALIPSFYKPEFPRKSIFDPLRDADLCIPVTAMGKKILEDHEVKNIVDNIYLGIDYNKRCVDVSLTKSSVFGGVSEDDFIFMTVGRNSERKKIDKIIEAFAEFLKAKEFEKDTIKYKLYVHTDFSDYAGGTDLIALCQSLDILDDVMFPQHFVLNQIMTDADLYKRYFVSDAYIELSAGEGMCLPIMDALLHNKPVIYLDYGGHAEYCKDRGYAVHVKDYFCARNLNMKWALPSIPDAVNKMCLVSQLKETSDTSEFVKETFDWDSVILPKILNTIKEKFVQKEKVSFNMKRVI